MTNVIISALIALFFLGKSSQEAEEKTNRASWPRTFVYLFLTIIFSVIYYRSFQVSTIINKVEITSLRGVEDSLHQSKDTIETIALYNNFKALGSYKNPYFDYLKKELKATDDGGFGVSIKPSATSQDSIINRDGLTDERKEGIELLTGKSIDSNCGTIYDLEFLATSIPSLIPVYPAMRYDEPIVTNTFDYSKIEQMGNLNSSKEGKIMVGKSKPAEGLFLEALSYQQTTVNHHKETVFVEIKKPLPLVNTIDILTAADLSQYTYCIEVNTEMYIKHLSVSYNVPVEIGNQAEGFTISANGFDITDADLLNNSVRNKPAMFLVKLPTMDNLQQIRSLILTAIVTALLSLFCSNLYYRVRKGAMNYQNKRQLTISESMIKRMNDFKSFTYCVILSSLFVIFIIACLAAFGYTFLIQDSYVGWKFAISLIAIIASLSIVVYCIYKLATSPVKKKGDGGRNKS